MVIALYFIALLQNIRPFLRIVFVAYSSDPVSMIK